MEDIGKNKNAIEDFVQKSFDMVRVNEGGGKWYSSIYSDFKYNALERNLESLNKVSVCRTAKHFGY